MLFLRPTESATVFLQQLGRGLRLADDKPCLTVLDFIGNQHAEFRFDLRYRALTGASRRGLVREIEQGFPTLPAGCHIELDRVAAELVLRNVASSLRIDWQGLVAELRNSATSPSRPSSTRPGSSSTTSTGDAGRLGRPAAPGWARRPAAWRRRRQARRRHRTHAARRRPRAAHVPRRPALPARAAERPAAGRARSPPSGDAPLLALGWNEPLDRSGDGTPTALGEPGPAGGAGPTRGVAAHGGSAASPGLWTRRGASRSTSTPATAWPSCSPPSAFPTLAHVRPGREVDGGRGRPTSSCSTCARPRSTSRRRRCTPTGRSRRRSSSGSRRARPRRRRRPDSATSTTASAARPSICSSARPRRRRRPRRPCVRLRRAGLVRQPHR